MGGVKSGQLYKSEGNVYKVLACDAGRVLVINCRKVSMPKWLPEPEISGLEAATVDDIPAKGREGELTDKEHEDYSTSCDNMAEFSLIIILATAGF
ncbi:MAG: hypothetical protein IJ106_05785 [Parasporobacterium sp.]|nr:hypothetical protein [Parasporobacterium sp.]